MPNKQDAVDCFLFAGAMKILTYVYYAFYIVDNDMTFDNATEVPFLLMAGDSVCFNATVTDDNLNERPEYAHFSLYLHNDFTTDKRIDEEVIKICDNEDG